MRLVTGGQPLRPRNQPSCLSASVPECRALPGTLRVESGSPPAWMTAVRPDNSPLVKKLLFRIAHQERKQRESRVAHQCDSALQAFEGKIFQASDLLVSACTTTVSQHRPPFLATDHGHCSSSHSKPLNVSRAGRVERTTTRWSPRLAPCTPRRCSCGLCR